MLGIAALLCVVKARNGIQLLGYNYLCFLCALSIFKSMHVVPTEGALVQWC